MHGCPAILLQGSLGINPNATIACICQRCSSASEAIQPFTVGLWGTLLLLGNIVPIDRCLNDDIMGKLSS